MTHKVKTICRRSGTNLDLDTLLRQLNPALQGWCMYFRPGVSSRTFGYLRAYTWSRVWIWLRHKHSRSNWKQLKRQYCPDGGMWPATSDRKLFNPASVHTTRYRYRGTVIPSPWPVTGAASH